MEKISFDIKDIEFIQEEQDEAFASVSLNPTFRWMKFILTDDQPNLNKKRIPQEEFDNLIRTGIHAPIKMEAGEIGNHPNATPLGVITALKKEGNQIKGLAALWSEERPEDVEMIKKRYDAKEPLDLSWEIKYAGLDDEDNGIQALKNTALMATTFVARPAYAGRTQAIEVASDNSVSEEEKLDELEQAKARIAELESAIAEKDSALTAKDSEIASLKQTNEELSAFKAEIDKEAAELEKLESIKVKFTEAGLKKEDEYFTSNRERLLGMEESALDFMIQEFVAFASSSADNKTSSSVSIPDLSNSKTSLSGRDLGKKLREQRK